MLVEVPTYDINGSFAVVEQKFSFNFTKAKTKFCSSLHYNGDNSYLFINGIKIYNFKADNGIVNFPAEFCLGSIFNGFVTVDSKEVSLKGNEYDFSVDYNAIDKSDMSNIHKYLTVKNNINISSGLLNICLLYYLVLADL